LLINFKISNPIISNVSYSLLITTLIASIYSFYKFGIKSNSVYQHNDAIVFGITGDSASGKTTTLSLITSIFKEKIIDLEGDGDHKWERKNKNWDKYTHLNPKANYLHRQAQDIYHLKKGINIKRIDYDHKTGKFTTPKNLKSNDYIIISGLHTFYLPIMRNVIDLKIFVDTDERVRKHWKIIRDVNKRGYSVNAVSKQINERSKDADKYIKPQINYSDLIINYYPKKSFEIGNPKIKPNLNLKLIFNSNIQIDKLLFYFEKKNINVEWDYSDDLQNQYIIFSQTINKNDIKNIAYSTIMNIEELVSDNAVWHEGYDGIIQLFILKITSNFYINTLN
jgi:uridine kinase